MYCVISTTFTTLDVIDLRCYVVLGLVPDLHVVSVILIVICRILSHFAEQETETQRDYEKFPGPARLKGWSQNASPDQCGCKAQAPKHNAAPLH